MIVPDQGGRTVKSNQTLPRLAGSLPLYEGSEAALLVYSAAAQEEALTGLHLKNADLSEEVLEKLDVTGCRLEGCRFARCTLSKASFVDCVFTGCDFSGAKAEDSYFLRCQMTGCKLLGADFSESLWRHTGLESCLLRLASFDRAGWEQVALTDCACGGIWLTHMKLKQPAFSRCDLQDACLTGTPLNGVDLRGCTLEGLTAGESLDELRGAVVDELGALSLARLLGITIS